MKQFYTKLLLLALCATAALPSRAHDCVVDGIYYNLDEEAGTATVTYRDSSYDSYSNEYTGNVVIPSTFDYGGITYSVTSIGFAAFDDCTGLTSVTISNSVTKIVSNAFWGCI